jgi:hypothetical protein
MCEYIVIVCAYYSTFLFICQEPIAARERFGGIPVQKSGVRYRAGGSGEGTRNEASGGLCGDSDARRGRGCDQLGRVVSGMQAVQQGGQLFHLGVLRVNAPGFGQGFGGQIVSCYYSATVIPSDRKEHSD